MPFSTDNSWPAGLLKIFEICREMNKPLENRYYGPYDKLINYCFGDCFIFFVAPQHPPDDATKEAIDFIDFLIVFDTLRRPVLIAQVKDDSWARNPGLRLEADEQLRRRYNIMLSDCPLPRLWGLSLLGTSVRVFLEGGWDLDILSQEGFEKMKEIVVDITTDTAAFTYHSSSS